MQHSICTYTLPLYILPTSFTYTYLHITSCSSISIHKCNVPISSKLHLHVYNYKHEIVYSLASILPQTGISEYTGSNTRSGTLEHVQDGASIPNGNRSVTWLNVDTISPCKMLIVITLSSPTKMNSICVKQFATWNDGFSLNAR